MAQQEEARLRTSLGEGRSQELQASQVVPRKAVAMAVGLVALVALVVALQVVALQLVALLGVQALAPAASPRLPTDLAVQVVALQVVALWLVALLGAQALALAASQVVARQVVAGQVVALQVVTQALALAASPRLRRHLAVACEVASNPKVGHATLAGRASRTWTVATLLGKG